MERSSDVTTDTIISSLSEACTTQKLRSWYKSCRTTVHQSQGRCVKPNQRLWTDWCAVVGRADSYIPNLYIERLLLWTDWCAVVGRADNCQDLQLYLLRGRKIFSLKEVTTIITFLTPFLTPFVSDSVCFRISCPKPWSARVICHRRLLKLQRPSTTPKPRVTSPERRLRRGSLLTNICANRATVFTSWTRNDGQNMSENTRIC